MIKTFERIMMAQNANAVKYIKVSSLRAAKGQIKEINNQINRDFGYSGHFAISSLSEQIHGVRWASTREALVVETHISRVLKEVVAAAVSQINKCAYCSEAHGTSIISAGDPETAKALINGNWKSISDKKTKSLIEWSLNNRNPNAAIILNPPFTAEEAPEIIGTALAFHSINRLADIFLEKSPFPKLLNYSFIKPLSTRIATLTLFKSMVSKKAKAGDSLVFLPQPTSTSKQKWATSVPDLQRALNAKSTLLIELEKEHIPNNMAKIFKTYLSDWQGEDMPMGRQWIQEISGNLEGEEKALLKIIFLTAFTPYTIKETDISEFKKYRPTYKSLIEVCYWSAEMITSRISDWLTKPFN